MMALLMSITSLAFTNSTPANAESTNSNDTNTVGKAISLNNVYALSSNWKIQSSAIATQDGAAVSASSYNTTGWFKTTVPNTVLGALIQAGNVPDPYIGDGIAKIDESRFTVPWWYRTEFTLPASEQGKRILVNFQGIAYTGDIWVNGHQIAKTSDIVGSFRTYELDITDYIISDGVTKNTIAVSVSRSDYGKDFSLYWVDWVPRPPDNNMGIWRDVFITTSDVVKTRNPFVTSKVENDLSAAHLNAYVEVSNNSGASVSGIMEATIKDPSNTVLAVVSQPLTVNAGAKDQEVAFTSNKFNELNISKPQLWWPKDMGGQPMYTIEFKFTANNKVSDSITQRFGIREINTEMNVSPSVRTNPPLKDMVQFYVNHKPVLIKAGGYSPTDLFLRRNSDTNRAVVQYLQDMGMNAIRDEGMFFDDSLLDLLDANGIMYMTGWVCCSKWQQPAQYTDADIAVASASLNSQLRIARVHPSMIAWMNGSDDPASLSSTGRGKEVEQKYLDIEHQMHWDEYGAIISSGSAKVATLTGTVGGMHMDATYDYAPPAMYFEDMNDGGAFGFTSEAGPGPSIPVIETMKKILPANALWPYNVGGDNFQQWNYHNARSNFRDLSNFNRAMDNHYGQSNSLEEYNIKAQVQQYDAQRAQYEAVNANKYTKASGWVQWMLNNAWPSFYWNLFDYYMNPNGSYFGAKIANEPLHIMYDYASKQVKIINSTQNNYNSLNAKIQIYNTDSSKVYEKEFNNLAVTPDGASAAVGGVPKQIGYQTINFQGKINNAYGITVVDGIDEGSIAVTPTYFLRLELRDANNKLVSVNSYAQTTKKDLVRYANHGWNYTPQNQYADFTQLQKLKPVDLQIVGTPKAVTQGQEQTLTYTVKNNGNSIAYAVFAKIRKGVYGDLIAPVRMEDNYFLLLPGEERTLTAKYNLSDLGNANPYVEVNSYNNLTTKQNPTPTSANLARGKSATASTTQGSNNASNALDNTVYTKWQSSTNTGTGADPQWYKVDFGTPTKFSRAIVRWDYANYAQNMTIEVSDDNTNWQTVYTGKNSNGSAMSDLQFAPVTKRYIRLTMSGKRPAGPQIGSGGTGQGVTGLGATAASTSFNIAEFEVYDQSSDRLTPFLGGTGTVNAGDEFSLIYGLSNVKNGIFAQDVTISYNPAQVEFVKAESLLKDKFTIVDFKNNTELGKVRIIGASLGSDNMVINGGEVIKLNWKAKQNASGPVTLELSKVVLGDNVGDETTPALESEASHVVIVNPADRTVLSFKISEAKTTYNQAVEGGDYGQYPAGTKAVLLAAITSAEAVLNNGAATQNQIAQAVTDLNAALAAFKAQIIILEKEALSAIINTAQSSHDSAVEGTKAGQYPAGSKATLLAAIASARTVYNNAGATQAQVDQATNDLRVALAAFNALVIKPTPGDMNGDGKVSIGDLAVIASNYGRSSTDPDWDLYKFADLNGDGKIDIVDLAIIASKILEIE
ncbi:glycosyl hydrolase 2 galactose-binding domain-containing protein [Paenibacillus planticolens]|nr:discoidin domain-containing protein [Paenibacillus planticolens]